MLLYFLLLYNMVYIIFYIYNYSIIVYNSLVSWLNVQCQYQISTVHCHRLSIAGTSNWSIGRPGMGGWE